ncbi:MAG: glycosyltransferase [Chloroflexi bacterium]|nr:glycosyltransferase [Chloroflexota bacterium]
MRIAYLAPFGLRPKGTTVSRVLPLARALASQGAQVRLVIPPWDDPGSAGKQVLEGDLEIVHASLTPHPGRFFALIRELNRLVVAYEPDVVHVFKPIGYSGLLAWWWANRWKGDQAPLLFLDCDDLEGAAGWGGRRGLGSLGFVRGLQETQTIRAVGRVTAASRWLESYVSRLGVSAEDIQYLPNGWSSADRTELEDPAFAAAPAGPPALLWYTRFTEAKPARAAELLAQLLRPDPSRRLIILGDELERGAQGKLRWALEQRGVGAQVDWLPYAPGTLARIVRTRDIVAVYPLDDDLTNLARCPAKIVELMSLGVPVVAEAVGEATTYLREFATDCLTSPGDSDALGRSVEQLVRNPGKRESLGDGLRQEAVRWEWAGLGANLMAWYVEEQARVQPLGR